jgi:ribosomal protein S18 acetylase RimI-like enzyme
MRIAGGVYMDIKIHSDFANADLDEMKAIYASVGWTKHTNEIIKKVFEASNVIALVTVNGRIIGFGRAMTDGVFNAAIYDVVVHRDFQGQGIAKTIMEFLLDKLSNVSCVHLISTTGNEELYRKLGLKKLKTGMARYLNPMLSDEYLSNL